MEATENERDNDEDANDRRRYELGADRLLKSAQADLQAIQESRQRTEHIHEKTQAALDDVFRTLERLASRRVSRIVI